MSTAEMIPWWDPRLAYAEDSPLVASYRRLQSRWREDELHLPPGEHVNSRTGAAYPLGSRLPAGTPLSEQLLSEEAVERARRRYPRLGANSQLRVDMLSSKPLCFSLFGHLDAHAGAAARVFDAALPWPIDAVEGIYLEHAPKAAARRLGGEKQDRTSFDAMLVLRSGGRRLLLGVETKYTEPFTQERFDKPSYRTLTARSDSWFASGAADTAVALSTNQLWRNLMLAQEAEVDAGYPAAVVVVAPRSNDHARRAVRQMAGLLEDPDPRLALVDLEDILAAAAAEPRPHALGGNLLPPLPRPLLGRHPHLTVARRATDRRLKVPLRADSQGPSRGRRRNSYCRARPRRARAPTTPSFARAPALAPPDLGAPSTSPHRGWRSTSLSKVPCARSVSADSPMAPSLWLGPASHQPG